jgi:hypothetical protein
MRSGLGGCSALTSALCGPFAGKIAHPDEASAAPSPQTRISPRTARITAPSASICNQFTSSNLSGLLRQGNTESVKLRISNRLSGNSLIYPSFYCDRLRTCTAPMRQFLTRIAGQGAVCRRGAIAESPGARIAAAASTIGSDDVDRARESARVAPANQNQAQHRRARP